jgi:RNA polymerase sigma-B factor
MSSASGSSERDRLIEDHLALARAVARRFANRGEPLEDLVQVASFALVKAARGFDPQRGAAFATYATSMMIGELKHHFRDRGWQLKAPRRLQDLYLELTRTTSELSQQFGRSPTVHELATALSVRDDEVIAALEAGRGYRADSLDAYPRDSARLERATAVDNLETTFEDRSELQRLLEHLPERERIILQLRFIEDQTQEEIASELNISQMHVSRLLRHAIETLRGYYDAT